MSVGASSSHFAPVLRFHSSWSFLGIGGLNKSLFGPPSVDADRSFTNIYHMSSVRTSCLNILIVSTSWLHRVLQFTGTFFVPQFCQWYTSTLLPLCKSRSWLLSPQGISKLSNGPSAVLGWTLQWFQRNGAAISHRGFQQFWAVKEHCFCKLGCRRRSQLQLLEVTRALHSNWCQHQ